MPSVKTLTCNLCGRPMWAGRGSNAQGEARCHECRRQQPSPYRRLDARSCLACATTFYSRRAAQKFCGITCSNKYYGARRQVRAGDDAHQRRCERASAAPGLSAANRSRLLRRWMRQGRACIYCGAPANTVDHVVPLVRGGTNFEGNLAPCCKACNSSKAGRLLIGWRGRRSGVLRA